MTHDNGAIILSVLALLGALGLLAISALAWVWGRTMKLPNISRLAVLAGGSIASLYAVLLVGIGAASSDRTLPVGSEKYFCELDCHLAYSVTKLWRVGDTGGRTTWAVSLRTRFDESTISPTRPREAPLTPNPRRARLRTGDGREFGPLADSAERLTALGIASVPLDRALRPGDSYGTTLLFELPVGALPLLLDLTEDAVPDRLLIGHEASPFHGRALLALPAPSLAVR
jgi:hypothetical protein